MPVYFRKMAGSRWKTLEVNDEEIEQVTKEYFLHNLMVMERCILNVNKLVEKSEKLKGLTLTQEMKDRMAVCLMDKIISPLHFALDNYVEKRLETESDNL